MVSPAGGSERWSMLDAPALLASAPDLLDDRSEIDFPAAYRILLRASSRLDVAATRIRLGGLHLSPGELAGPTRLRVLLMELNAHTLRSEADRLALDSQGSERVRGLRSLLSEERLEVRCLPLGGWAPDFSIFYIEPDTHAALVGPHWMERPYPQRGPGLASLHAGEPVRRLGTRFHDLWSTAHDVSAALERVLTDRETTRPVRVDTRRGSEPFFGS